MVKDIIIYNEKEYQLSTIFIDTASIFETMIFPIENGIVSGNEVFCHRVYNAENSKNTHEDICNNPEKYLSDKAIEQYFACKRCNEWCCTLCEHAPTKFSKYM